MNGDPAGGRPIILLTIFDMEEPTEKKWFHTSYLSPAFADLQDYFHTEHEIVPSTHFGDHHEPEQYHNKVVIGRLLAITNPDRTGYYGRTTQMSFSGVMGAKRQKANPPHSSAIMLTFGDYYRMPNCFCIFVERKTSFQELFGDDNTRCEGLRIGDFVAVKDPKPSTERLGESIVVLRDPTVIVILKNEGWPSNHMITSDATNWQIFFDDNAKQVTFFGPHLVGNKLVNKCKGYTCDRQAHCKGCFGKAPTNKPLVMMVAVKVSDVPGYKSNTNSAYFPSVCRVITVHPPDKWLKGHVQPFTVTPKS